MTRPFFFFAADKGNEVRVPALSSLLDAPAGAQGDFFSLLDVEVKQRKADYGLPGDYTGERIFSQFPQTYRAIVDALARRTSARRIAEALHVSPNTVRAVRNREGISVDALRAKAKQAATEALADHLEAACEEIEKVAPAQRFVPIGILADTIDKLGGASNGEPQVPERDELAEFEAYLMGLGGEGRGQKGALVAGADGVALAVTGVPSDVRSDGSTGSGRDVATTCATTDAPGAVVVETGVSTAGTTGGGEGGRFAPPPAMYPIHSATDGPGVKDPSGAGFIGKGGGAGALEEETAPPPAVVTVTGAEAFTSPVVAVAPLGLGLEISEKKEGGAGCLE